MAVSAKNGFGSVVVENSKGHEGFSNANRSVKSGRCDLVREIQDLVHNLSGKTVRRGSWEGRGREEFRGRSRSYLFCLSVIVENQDIGRGIGARALRWRVFIKLGCSDCTEGLKTGGKIWNDELTVSNLI